MVGDRLHAGFCGIYDKEIQVIGIPTCMVGDRRQRSL